MEYRCILGSIAFSRVVHYWEVTVDRQDGNGDIVVGVAQSSINLQTMLGCVFKLFKRISFII